MTARAGLLQVARPLLGSVQHNQLARLVPAAQAAAEAEPRSLLDVGSGSRGISRWVGSGIRIVAVDMAFDDYGGARRFGERRAVPVLGDVRRLPFADGAFDVVTAVDLLEHVPPDGRQAALRELVRVTRRRLVVAGPVGPAALEADATIARELRTRGQLLPGWLSEHLDNGMPSEQEIETELAQHGRVTTTPGVTTQAHVRMVLADLSPARFVQRRIGAAAMGAFIRGPEQLRPLGLRMLERACGQAVDAGAAYRIVYTLDLPVVPQEQRGVHRSPPD